MEGSDEEPVKFGRSRGRARGSVMQPSEGAPPGIAPTSPGRPLEPRMMGLSLSPASGGNGNGNGNGNGHANGNGHGNGGTVAVRGRPGPRELTYEMFDFFVTRPEGSTKTGTIGDQIGLVANYFPTRKTAEWSLFHYHLTFPGEEDRKWVKRSILRSFSGIAPGKLGSFIYDGGSSLYSATRVGINELVGEFDNNIVIVTIKLVAQIPPGDIVYLQFYNILVRKCLQALGLSLMGRNYFDPNMAIEMAQHRLMLWPGFVTTLRQHDAGLLYCVELTHKVIRMDNVFQLIRQLRAEVEGRGGNMTEVKKKVAEEMVGRIVMTTYNKKTYRVDAIKWDDRPTNKFPRTKGGVTTEVSFIDYYQERYNSTIEFKNQPMLQSNRKLRDIRMGLTEPFVLVPELCQLTGLTDSMRQNFSLMKEMGVHLFQPPGEKVKSITTFVRRLRENEGVRAELSGWGIEIGPNPVKLGGRVLPRESIQFLDSRNEKSTFPANEKADFTMAFRSQKMVRSIDLRSWVVIVPARDAQSVDNLVRTMQTVAKNMGFKIAPETQRVPLQYQNGPAYVKAITDALRTFGKELQMVFVILPNNKLDTYAAVKKRCYVDAGLPSQCFLSRNVTNKGLMSIATKVVVQMNAKLGGEPWNVVIPLKTLMIVGFDVYHGGEGSQTPSVGAMTCTISESFGTFYSTVSFFQQRQEVSKNMASDIGKCCTAFRLSNNGQLPSRIVFYRDGVGEGQLGSVFNTELVAIRNQLSALYKDNGRDPPAFTFIVCTKRINTRLILSNPRGYDNPPPGTVVDTFVTLPERWDFFLIAQQARQGVVSPTNYNVLFDTNGLDPNKIQRLTYKVCHLYFNWSGTVAVPAVCQYAHKLAYLTGMATQQPNHPDLSRLLYFL